MPRDQLVLRGLQEQLALRENVIVSIAIHANIPNAIHGKIPILVDILNVIHGKIPNAIHGKIPIHVNIPNVIHASILNVAV
ncbi:hypothetical protein PIPA1_34520 [Pelosinus sp. IPA-1]|nr:hypothetical protein PIPA1_34520 [Pelosinus sp. IPA-1]